MEGLLSLEIVSIQRSHRQQLLNLVGHRTKQKDMSTGEWLVRRSRVDNGKEMGRGDARARISRIYHTHNFKLLRNKFDKNGISDHRVFSI